ncbi:hypothetical protein JCM16303_004622 [Sporobolomyces ruberrimus]
MTAESAPPQSLLATACSLRSQLEHLDGAHPLSSPSPSTFDHLRTHTTTTLSNLRSALASLHGLLPLPNGGVTLPRSTPSRLELDKFLSLLSQSATTESLLLSLAQSTPSHPRTPAKYPILHPGELETRDAVLPILERIAKDLGLVCFRDDEGDDPGQEPRGLVTLSLGGKVMVVDFEVARTHGHESVDKVKVAYVWKGEQYFDEKSAKRLTQAFSVARTSGPIGALAHGEREEMWSNVARVLKELYDLDYRTSREELNYFGKLSRLVERVEEEFPLAESSLSCPARLVDPSSLYPRLLLDASPAALLHPRTSTYLRSHSATSATDLQGFLEQPGIISARVQLPVIPRSSSLTEALGPEHEDLGSWYQIRVSPQTGVPLPRRVALEVWAALSTGVSAAQPPSGFTKPTMARNIDGKDPRWRDRSEERGIKGKGRENLAQLLTAAWSQSELDPQASERKFKGGRRETGRREAQGSHTTSFEPVPNRPCSYTFRLAEIASPTGYPAHAEDDVEPAFILRDLWLQVSGEHARTRPVSGQYSEMRNLRNSIEILRQQIRINQLLTSVMNAPDRDAAEDEHVAQVGLDSTKRKRRRVEQREPQPTRGLEAKELDALLRSHLADSTPSLPIFIHTSVGALGEPALLLSFPSPHLPQIRASPITIRIQSTPTHSGETGGFDIQVETKLAQVRDRLEPRAGKLILEKTRDLGIFVHWVVTRLCSEA